MIELRTFQNVPVKIINPDGTMLIETDNEYTFLDICCQIKEQGLEGYSIQISNGGEVIIRNIATDGYVDNPPRNFFHHYDDFINRLMGVNITPPTE